MTKLNGTHALVQKFLQFLSQRDLDNIVELFSDSVDWYIPGDTSKAPWLGRRKSRQEVSDFYELLWEYTAPVSAEIYNIFYDGGDTVVSGEFSTKMLQTSKVVDSLFFIQMRIENEKIVSFRLLEDSHAVSVALS